MRTTSIKTLFLDVGGVLLTNGWDRKSRELACKTFKLDYAEIEGRHNQTFDTYEIGKLSLSEYLKRVIFYEKREFTHAQFKNFMFSQSKAYPEMITLICKLKAKYNLKIAVVSNEGRELNAYRIKKFKLDHFIDFFISSCYVHFRKPDEDMYRLALDVAQVIPENVLYIDDRAMFVQVAKNMEIHGILHTDYATTVKKLAEFGLKIS